MMIQYKTGITSTLKKDKQFSSPAINSKDKKTQHTLKPKTPKITNFPKEHPLLIQASDSNKFITVEESCQQLPTQTKSKSNFHNLSGKTLKVSNNYFNEHFINGLKRKHDKIQTIAKPPQIAKPKHPKNQQKQNQKTQSPFHNMNELIQARNLFQNVPQRAQIDSQVTAKSKDYNKKWSQDQYKRQKQQIKPRLKLGNRIRPIRSVSSSSGQSQNSYYGIVAQYRKRRLQSQDQLDRKAYLQNAVSLSGSGKGSRLINRVKSQNLIKLTSSMNEPQINQKGIIVWKRPQIGISQSSKRSLKSSQSNLSQSIRNPIEQKVILMRQHLKLRKRNIDLSNQNINPFALSNTIHDSFKNLTQTQTSPIQDMAQYRQQIPDESEAIKYKELYKISLDKVKNMERQLEIQKKKNQLTKNIFKSQISKLKRARSFDSLNQQKKSQSKISRVFERIDTAEGDYPQGITIRCNIKQQQSQANTINQLRNKLKNSHLFSYEEYQGVTVNPIKSTKFSFLSPKEDQCHSILQPNEEKLVVDNTSNEMIVEMSSEWRESGFGSSFTKSKLENSRRQNDYQQKMTENVEFSFKKIDYCLDDSINNRSSNQVKDDTEDQSMLLDISSNIDQGKTQKNPARINNQPTNMVNFLESKELVESQIIVLQCKNDPTPRVVINKVQCSDNKTKNTKDKAFKPKTDSRDAIKSKFRKDFAEDLTKRLIPGNYESEYQSTQSSNAVRSRYKKLKNGYFNYQ